MKDHFGFVGCEHCILFTSIVDRASFVDHPLCHKIATKVSSKTFINDYRIFPFVEIIDEGYKTNIPCLYSEVPVESMRPSENSTMQATSEPIDSTRTSQA